MVEGTRPRRPSWRFETRENVMDYRLYVLNSAGKFADFEEWDCASDEAAIERASDHRHAYGAELWRGTERLTVFSGAMRPEVGSA